MRMLVLVLARIMSRVTMPMEVIVLMTVLSVRTEVLDDRGGNHVQNDCVLAQSMLYRRDGGHDYGSVERCTDLNL